MVDTKPKDEVGVATGRTLMVGAEAEVVEECRQSNMHLKLLSKYLLYFNVAAWLDVVKRLT